MYSEGLQGNDLMSNGRGHQKWCDHDLEIGKQWEIAFGKAVAEKNIEVASSREYDVLR